jgi:hypothetical protein
MLRLVRALLPLSLLALAVLPFGQEAKLVTVLLVVALASLLLRARPARL